MTDTPSDKVVFLLAPVPVFVSVAIMSAEFGGTKITGSEGELLSGS